LARMFGAGGVQLGVCAGGELIGGIGPYGWGLNLGG